MLTILLVEQDGGQRETIRTQLREAGYQVMSAADEEEGWRWLSRRPVDCLLDGSGTDGKLVARIRAQEWMRPLYILKLLPAGAEPTAGRAALAQGADDFLRRPLVETDLLARVEIARRALGQMNDLYTMRHQLALFSPYDNATGLFNRQSIMIRAEAELNRAQRLHLPLTLALFRVEVGEGPKPEGFLEQMMRLAASILTENLRSYDAAGRWAENQFLLVIPHTDPATISAIASRLYHSLDETHLALPPTLRQEIQVLIGVSGTTLGDPQPLEALLEQAANSMQPL